MQIALKVLPFIKKAIMTQKLFFLFTLQAWISSIAWPATTVLDGIQVAVGEASSKACGMMAPGATFDIDCNLLPFPPPINRQGDAVVEGEVTKVECGEKLQDSQVYFATIKVRKVISGKIPEPLKLKFTRYFDRQPRLGANGIHFLPGEISELTLTKYPNYWAVQFPFHKKIIRQSSNILHSCP